MTAQAFTYEEQPDWAQLPVGWTFHEVVDVVVDRQDRVYIFTRGEHPVIVFAQDGTFLTSWGEGIFNRPHGLTLAPDGNSLWCTDDEAHVIYQFSLDGELLTTIGTPGQGAPAHSGQPFNKPTKVAFDPKTGDLYISDGYGNARVHKFTVDGRHLFSWGDFGVEAGRFNLPHSVCTDAQGRVYVADRENHRVQVFDAQGNYLSQWNNLHRPCAFHIAGDLAYIGQLPSHLDVNLKFPNIGACITIHDLTGKQLARIGDAHRGEGPNQYTAPHGIAVDSRGDLYVAEVSYSAYGRLLNPPRTARSFRKLVKK